MHRAPVSAQSSADGSGAQSGGQRESARNVSRADFALQIIDTPAVGARPGSADELAALGLDRHLRLAESTKYQGEAGLCELEKRKICLTDAASSWKSIL